MPFSRIILLGLFLSALPVSAEVLITTHKTRTMQLPVSSPQQLPKRRAVTREEFAELLGDMRATFAECASVRSTAAGAKVLQEELRDLMAEQGVAEMNFNYHANGLLQLVNVRFETHVRMHEALLRPELKKKLTRSEKTTLAKAREIYTQCCKPSMKLADKLRALHDRLINLAHYDKHHRMAASDLLLPPHSGTCLAYARTYAILLDMAGIPNAIQFGSTQSDQDSETHAWNVITLGGTRYHIDCAWDDPEAHTSSAEYLEHNSEPLHRWFFKTDDQMSDDHHW